MQITSGFLLHTVGDEYVVVAVEERTVEFHGMIRLNESGAFLWERMQTTTTEADLAAALVAHYGVTETVASDAVTGFVAQLTAAGVLEP